MKMPFVRRWYDRKGNRIRAVTGHELMSRGPTSGDGMRVAIGYVDTPISASAVRGSVMTRVIVSTVWLGWDHQKGKGDPILFETGIIDSAMAYLQGGQWKVVERYATEDQAIRGHHGWLEKILVALPGAVMSGGYTTGRNDVRPEQAKAPEVAQRANVTPQRQAN